MSKNRELADLASKDLATQAELDAAEARVLINELEG